MTLDVLIFNIFAQVKHNLKKQFTFVETLEIKTIYRIIHSKQELWNTLGKYFLTSYDSKFGEDYFLCKCSDLRTLNLSKIPLFYKKLLVTWTNLRKKIKICNDRESIYKQRLFGNSQILHNKLPVYFQSFNMSKLTTIRDIWNENKNEFLSTQNIYNKLTNRINYLSEISIIKKAIPPQFIEILKHNNTTTIKQDTYINDNTLHIGDKNSIITVKGLTQTLVYTINNKDILPRVETKWKQTLNLENSFDWNKVCNFHQTPLFTNILDFQWKSLHDILYTESKLFMCRLSNGKCHFCKISKEDQIHLFVDCTILSTVIEKLNDILNTMYDNIHIPVLNKNSIILGLNIHAKKEENNFQRFIILTYKWTIWKIRNTVKYDGKKYNSNQILKFTLLAIKENLYMYLNSNLKDSK